MICVREFGDVLKSHRFDFFSGVPCSFLKSFINYSINHLNYIGATNEGEAVAIAAGAFLGGRRSGVLLQNSGLTNAMAPLTSLNPIFRIPVLGLVSLRGEPGVADEPQHALLGKITAQLLESCEIKALVLGREISEVREQFEYAEKYWRENRSVFFIVRKDTFSEEKLEARLKFDLAPKKVFLSEKKGSLPSRQEVLSLINSLKDKRTVLLATTGKTGRELFEIENSPQHLYMVGSMGCVSSLGLGLSLARPEKKVIAIDGDGALLMRLGSLATNGYYRPANLLHIVLDNQSHDSTGGQETVSQNLCFPSLAVNAGYPQAIQTPDLDSLKIEIQKWQQHGGLTFLHAPIALGSKEGLGRPTLSPASVKENLIAYLKSN